MMHISWKIVPEVEIQMVTHDQARYRRSIDITARYTKAPRRVIVL